MYSNIITY